MHFLFVDRITNIGHSEIEGERLFAEDDPFQYAAGPGENLISSGAVSEAIGQLATWLSLAKNDFTAKPVYLFSDCVEVLGHARAGQNVELRSRIHHMDNDVLSFSGEATAEGRPLQRLKNCYAYFVPLAELNDPDETRQRFRDLAGRKLPREHVGHARIAFGRLIDKLLEVEPRRRVVATKTMRLDEPFYADHFPRRPITPVVMLSEMLTTAAEHLLASDGHPRLRPRLKGIHGLKIWHSIQPGDHCIAYVVEQEAAGVEGLLRTLGEVHMNGKRILRGVYDFALDA